MTDHKLTAEKLSEHLTVFTEYADHGHGLEPYVNAYLYQAEDSSAVLIDALEASAELYDEVAAMIDPAKLKVLLTHGHPDHAGISVPLFAARSIPIYMDLHDLPVAERMMPYLKKEWLHDLAGIKEISFGEKKLRVIPCYGHTPGSTVFFEEKTGLLFSGDAIGSGGFWMQLDHSLPLHVFEQNAKALYAEVKDHPDLSIMVGHRSQTSQPVSIQYFSDVLTATAGILAGSLKGEPLTMNLDGGKIDYCLCGYGLCTAYCYDPKNL